MNLERSNGDNYQQSTTQLHYFIANLSLHKLYRTARGSSSCLRRHVLIRSLLMCGAFDMVLNPISQRLKSAQITTASTTPPSDEEVWLERCFDDLADTDEDEIEDNDLVMGETHWRANDHQLYESGTVPDMPWFESAYHHKSEKYQDNALVPSMQLPQQLVVVIPFSHQMRDTVATKEANGSIISADDPAYTGKHGSIQKRHINSPVALIQWHGGNWAMC